MQTEKLLWYLGFMYRGNITVLICGFLFTAIDGSERGKFSLTLIWRIWCVTQPMSFYKCLRIALSLGSIRNVSSWGTQQQRSTKCFFLQPWAQSHDSMAMNDILFQKIACCLPLTGAALTGKAGIAHSSECAHHCTFWSFSRLVKRLNSNQRGEKQPQWKGASSWSFSESFIR